MCQTHTYKELECPAKKNSGDGNGYKYVADNLRAFQELKEYPGKVSIELLAKGYDDLETSLREHQASYHKTCRTSIGTTVY